MRLLVNIDVDDLDRGIAFYEAALGLKLSRRLFDGEVAEMLGAGATIYLLEHKAGSAAVLAHPSLCRRYDRHWTPVHVDFVVEDVAEAVRRALAAGAADEGGIRSFPWGRLATMSDPFGHGFCLLQFIGEGYGRVTRESEPGRH